jgi:hypothetical protein
MPKLKAVDISTQVADLTPLLELPALTSVRVAYDDTDANRAVVATLERRRVQLEKPL